MWIFNLLRNSIIFQRAVRKDSYNAVPKNGQTNFHIRFWDSSENLVIMYWNSEFLGKASAKDVYKKFNQGLSLLSFCSH